MADNAFANTPINPNIQPNVPAQDQPAQPQAPTAENNATQDKLQAWLTALKSPNSAGSNSPLPQTPPASNPEPQKVTPPTPSYSELQQQPIDAYNQNVVAQFSAMQQQNQQLQERLQQQEEVIKNLTQAQRAYTDLKNQVDASNINFGELSTIDADDAKAVAAGVMKAIAPQLDQIKQALQAQQQYTQRSNDWQNQRFAQQRAQEVISKVMDKHPDFIALQSDPNYLNFVQQRDGASSMTYDAHAAYEFQRGNADYIIDLINKYKQTLPSSNTITSVAPVQTASAQDIPSAPPLELPTLRELNQWMQMRQITQDQYRELLQKVMAQQKG